MILKLSNTYRLGLSLRTKPTDQQLNTAQIPKLGTAPPHTQHQLPHQSLDVSESIAISGLDCIEFGHPTINLANNTVAPCSCCILCRENVFSPNSPAAQGAACLDSTQQANERSVSHQSPPEIQLHGFAFREKSRRRDLSCSGASRLTRFSITCSSSCSRATELLQPAPQAVLSLPGSLVAAFSPKR